MYRVWKVVADKAYSGGMGLVGANTREEAQAVVDSYNRDQFYNQVALEDEIKGLYSEQKGWIEEDFYFE